MPRLLGVLRGRRSWQGPVGCHRRPLEEDRVRRLRFALCSAASAPSLPWRRREHTHAGFLRSHASTGVAYVRVRVKPVPAGARPMRRTSTSPPSPSRISDLDYAPSSASPATCPGSDWDRTAPWLGWLFVRTSRNPTSGTPLSWHESLCHAVMAGNCFEPQNFVAEVFPGGVSSPWQRPLIKGVSCYPKQTHALPPTAPLPTCNSTPQDAAVRNGQANSCAAHPPDTGLAAGAGLGGTELNWQSRSTERTTGCMGERGG